LGSAGHDGFALAAHTPNVYQLTFVKGGHGAAVEEDVWKTIAGFVVNDPSDTKPEFALQRRWRNWIVLLLGLFPPLIWVCACRCSRSGLAWPVSCHRYFGSLALYLLLLWRIATRV
jgi:hypothetical protein